MDLRGRLTEISEDCKLEQKPDREPKHSCSEAGRPGFPRQLDTFGEEMIPKLGRPVKGEPWGKCDDLHPFFSRSILNCNFLPLSCSGPPQNKGPLRGCVLGLTLVWALVPEVASPRQWPGPTPWLSQSWLLRACHSKVTTEVTCVLQS